MVELLDQEWVALIWKAKQLGLSKEEIRDFLNQQINGKQEDILVSS